MADGEVTLIIRSPSLRQEEKEIRAPRRCTVRELKTQLRQELPGEPMEQDQRLIYSGKLLPDHLRLNEVLSMENRHVLHLVCSMKSPPKNQAPDTKQCPGSTAGQHHSAPPLTDGVRQRNLPQNLHTEQTGTPRPHGVNPAFSVYSVYSPQQILWLQQMYARQYYMQYCAAAAATNSPIRRVQDLPVVAPAAPEPLHHPFPADNQPQNPDVQAPVNPVANPNLRMNAQGGLVEEDDDVNRDWLDWIYTAARFSIFLSILYFYSSLSRFMMVLGAMILMYLHHAGWFPFRRRPPQEAAVVNPPQAVPNNQDQNNNLQEENDQIQDPADNGTAEVIQAQSFVSTAWIFFKTFFASLIPEGPPAVVQ
ncbi:homocysteine-responsive endoplasmic reticulum-resident ubiquitin-like domain member 1 protein [Rhinophrynus dorsalis]